MRGFILILLYSMLCQLSHGQEEHKTAYTDSIDLPSAWKVKLSPINWFDNNSGDNISLQLEYFSGKYGFCLENNFYQNLRRDRFYSMQGNRTSLEIRRYKTVATTLMNSSVYSALEVSFKDQNYSTLAYIVNDKLDTNYFNTLSFDKKVYMFHFKVGTGGKINRYIEIELAVGLGVRYRIMHIDGLKYEDDRVGTWTREQHGTYRWMDHENTGLYPSFSLNMRFGIHINDLLVVINERRQSKNLE